MPSQDFSPWGPFTWDGLSCVQWASTDPYCYYILGSHSIYKIINVCLSNSLIILLIRLMTLTFQKVKGY